MKSGFYNSNNGDRVYDADAFSNFFEGLINDGIYDSVGAKFSVTKHNNTSTETGLSVDVGSGRAFLNKKWVYNPVTEKIDISSNVSVSSARTDAIAIKIDNNALRAASIEKIEGAEFTVTTGTDPTGSNPPTISDGNSVYYHVLAYVTVSCSSTVGDVTLTIEDRRGEFTTGSCTPFVNSLVEHITMDELHAEWKRQWDAMVAKLNRQITEGSEYQPKNYQLDDISISDDGWEETKDYDDYPWSFTYTDGDIDSSYVPNVYFSADEVLKGYLAGFASTSDGSFTIYATEKPEHDGGSFKIPIVIFIKQAG